MIDRIKLHNFQCHRDVDLKLGRSTLLSGDSNAGKSAILRALYWVIENTPGDHFVSYWAMDKGRFKKDEYTSVLIEVDGHTIERKRSASFNGYIVDGVVYEALRGDVPKTVTSILNLSDASIQKQMDPPFLLCQTAGEASQYLNHLANLECISDILVIARKASMDATDEYSNACAKYDQVTAGLEALDWVDEAHDLMTKAEALDDDISKMSAKVADLEKSLRLYDELPPIPDIPEWLINGRDYSADIAQITQDIAILSSYVEAKEEYNAIEPTLRFIDALGEYPDTSAVQETIRKLGLEFRAVQDADAEMAPMYDALVKLGALGSYPGDTGALASQISRLEQDISDVATFTSSAMADDAELDELATSLDGLVCPTCGRPYHGDH